MSDRELWTVIHGSAFGGLFILSLAVGAVAVYSMRPAWATAGGIRGRLPGLKWTTVAMAIFGWATVISGTWILYPWYRAPVPQGLSLERLNEYSRDFLLSNPNTAVLHSFGMEWKEHIAWIAPILATSVAFIVYYYGPRLVREPRVRNALLTLLALSFLAVVAASSFGSAIKNVAPV